MLDQLIHEQPQLGTRLHPNLPIRVAEVIWAVRNEWARSVDDVLARRTRALFLNAKASIEIAPIVASWMASELGRDASWQSDQVFKFRQMAKNFLP